MLKIIEVYKDERDQYANNPNIVAINPDHIVSIDITDGIIKLDNGIEYIVAWGIDSDLLDKLGAE